MLYEVITELAALEDELKVAEVDLSVAQKKVDIVEKQKQIVEVQVDKLNKLSSTLEGVKDGVHTAIGDIEKIKSK